MLDQKIRDAKNEVTYNRLVTDEGAVVVAKDSTALCKGCLFDHNEDGFKPKLHGHSCNDMPVCVGRLRSDRRNVIWVKEASNAAA
jgi:hypothetical protein